MLACLPTYLSLFHRTSSLFLCPWLYAYLSFWLRIIRHQVFFKATFSQRFDASFKSAFRLFSPFFIFACQSVYPSFPTHPIPSHAPSPSDLFQVERILKMQILGDGRKMFLVEWQGYPLGRCTWEPFENILALTFADMLMFLQPGTPHLTPSWGGQCSSWLEANLQVFQDCRPCQSCQSANLQVFSKTADPANLPILPICQFAGFFKIPKPSGRSPLEEGKAQRSKHSGENLFPGYESSDRVFWTARTPFQKKWHVSKKHASCSQKPHSFENKRQNLKVQKKISFFNFSSVVLIYFLFTQKCQSSTQPWWSLFCKATVCSDNLLVTVGCKINLSPISAKCGVFFGGAPLCRKLQAIPGKGDVAFSSHKTKL